MNTSSRLGLCTDTPSISPGKASTTSVTKRWPLLDLEAHADCRAPQPAIRSAARCAAPARRLARFEQNDVAADLALQLRGSAQRDDIAFGVNRQPVAALGLFHQVRGDQDGHMFFVAQNLQILPQVAPRARIEAGCWLIQQQHRRMMQQTLRQFQAALHAAGKCFGFLLRAIGEANARQHLGNALPSAPRRAVHRRGRPASGFLRPRA